MLVSRHDRILDSRFESLLKTFKRELGFRKSFKWLHVHKLQRWKRGCGQAGNSAGFDCCRSWNLWRKCCGGGDGGSRGWIARRSPAGMRWTAAVCVDVGISEPQSLHAAMDWDDWRGCETTWAGCRSKLMKIDTGCLSCCTFMYNSCTMNFALLHRSSTTAQS